MKKQVKSNYYYYFWGVATVAVVADVADVAVAAFPDKLPIKVPWNSGPLTRRTNITCP